MKLLIDLGNSAVKWAWYQDQNMEFKGSCVTRSGDFKEQLKQAWNAQPKPSQVVYCAVADQALVEQLEKLVDELWQVKAQRLIPQAHAFGLHCHYHQPSQLGADRWAAMIGAYTQNRHALCVVDCGTAVTIDALSADGQHQGGLIIPGEVLMRQVLGERTGRIGQIHDGNINLASVDTQGAVSTGCLLAVAAFIDRAVQDYQDLIADALQIFITGGDAEKLLPYLNSKPQLIPDLVLLGLAKFAEQQP